MRYSAALRAPERTYFRLSTGGITRMVTVVKLPKHSRVNRENAERARQALAEIDMPKEARAVLDNALYQITNIPGARAVFTMISNDQFRYVTRKIAELPDVGKTLLIWNTALTYVRQDTGEILANREQLSHETNTRPEHVSRAMSELEKIGAIIKSKRGRNVVYSVNPHVAWNGGYGARLEAMRTAPRLRLIEGGLPDVEPFLIERATSYLKTQTWKTRDDWAKRACQRGAPFSGSMSATENIQDWSRWVALELVNEGLISGDL